MELADGGTAFFDEIGDLPLEMQVQRLRLLEEREFPAVGALQWRKVDLRIIAATPRDLKKGVAAGRLRHDLYFRLNVFSLRLPPLRQGKSDIPLLVDPFLAAAQTAGLPAMQPSEPLMESLMAYNWPGNVRQLKHCMDPMSAMHSEGALQMEDLPSPLPYARAAAGLGRLSTMGNEEQGAGLPEVAMAPISPVISIP